MDDRVIEAAAKAILTEFGEVPYYRDMAEAAIRAALRAGGGGAGDGGLGRSLLDR